MKQERNNLVKNEEMWSGEHITSQRDAAHTEQTARNEGHLNVNERAVESDIAHVQPSNKLKQ